MAGADRERSSLRRSSARRASRRSRSPPPPGRLTCWALMLVMFAAGVASLWWMATLATVMFYEKVGRQGDALAKVVGVTLLVLGALVLLNPGWLPPVFSASFSRR
ncbi:MAG TPA: DUF2182 domain-containing protein [Actinomycetota bacterium]|nr:DUF2182 domain-containing protein [Actinomycetota bacterium]